MPSYSVSELFYSIQGEGCWIGKPAYFIRLAGCNLNCSFCDTDFSHKEYMDEHEIVDAVEGNLVVITGGEPLIHDLSPLVALLKKEGKVVHLESNGTLPLPCKFDWVTVSQKTQVAPRFMADAVKYLCGIPDWESIIRRTNARWHGLQPVSAEWEQTAVSFCLANPWLRYSPQLHKYLGMR